MSIWSYQNHFILYPPPHPTIYLVGWGTITSGDFQPAINDWGWIHVVNGTLPDNIFLSIGAVDLICQESVSSHTIELTEILLGLPASQSSLLECGHCCLQTAISAFTKLKLKWTDKYRPAGEANLFHNLSSQGWWKKLCSPGSLH